MIWVDAWRRWRGRRRAIRPFLIAIPHDRYNTLDHRRSPGLPERAGERGEQEERAAAIQPPGPAPGGLEGYTLHGRGIPPEDGGGRRPWCVRCGVAWFFAMYE